MVDEEDQVPLRSERGKEILAWATNQDYVILEFNEMDDGSTMIVDITGHVQELEEIVEGD